MFTFYDEAWGSEFSAWVYGFRVEVVLLRVRVCGLAVNLVWGIRFGIQRVSFYRAPTFRAKDYNFLREDWSKGGRSPSDPSIP